MNGHRVDLNLLYILDVLVRERHVSRAAAHVGLSQPAMSHSLQRLREALNDPILVRKGARMIPTPTALRLAPEIRDILAKSSELIQRERAFVPSTCRRTFRLGMTDYVTYLVLPNLIAEVHRMSPHAKIVVRQVGRDNGPREVTSGDVDIAIGTFPPTTSLHSELMFSRKYKCAVWEKNSKISRKLTMKQYLSAPHLLVQSSSGNSGVVDFELAKKGLKRNVACVVPHFLAAPAIVRGTDLILTLAEGALLRGAKEFDLRIIDPPLSLPNYEVTILWHQRSQTDPAQIWLRKLISQVASSGPAPLPFR